MDEHEKAARKMFDTLNEAGITLTSDDAITEIQRLATVDALEKARDICLDSAKLWDQAYTYRADDVPPSEYLVLRGQAVGAATIAARIKNMIDVIGRDDTPKAEA